MKWYVVHTFTAQEFRVKESIEKGKLSTEFDSLIGQILVPTQKTFHVREGKKIERERKIFNSYIIVEAELTQEVQTYIRNVPGVTNFLGTGKKPIPLSEQEVNRLLGIADREKTDVTEYSLLPGDRVKIIAGPFTDFEGTIEKISQEAKKLTVKVTVFGRVTPVEVSIEQVESI